MLSDSAARLRSTARSAARRAASAVRQADRRVGPVMAPTAGQQERDLILGSGLFDHEWVELQLDQRFATPQAAATAYLEHPDCTPHPLFLPEWIDKRFGSPGPGVDPLVWYLRNQRARRRASPHPLVDLRELLRLRPDLEDAPGGPLAAWLAGAGRDTPLPPPPGTTPLTLGQVQDASRRAVLEWRAGARFRIAPRTTPHPPGDLEDVAGPTVPGPGDRPLVSVVMPVWNRAAVVRRAIDSVRAQTHTDWELIVVDDGSDDDSVAVVRGLASFDDRISCVSAGHRGVSAARNTGIERARGDYVAFLDSDNTWEPHYLHVMLRRLEAEQWPMAHACLRAHKDGERYYRAFEGTRDHLLVANHVDLNVLVARTALVREVGGFDESLRRGVDYDLVLKLSERAPLRLVRTIGVDYADHEDAGPRISTSESSDWLSVIASRHLVDWDGLRRRDRVAGRTSVVVVARSSMRSTVRRMRESALTPDTEVVVVGVRLRCSQHVLLSVAAAALPLARLAAVQVQRGSATAANVAVAATTGDVVVLALGRTSPLGPDALVPLCGALGDGVTLAQPALLSADETVLSAGAVFGSRTTRPRPLLEDHPTSDLDVLGARGAVTLPAALSAVVAVDAAAFAAVGGLDPLLPEELAATDLSLRLAGASVLAPDVRVTSYDPVLPAPAALAPALRELDRRHPGPPPGSARCWADAGLEVVAEVAVPVRDPHDPPPGPADHPVLVPTSIVRAPRADVVSQSAPSLRWTIDLASPPGERGEAWGDTHYGRALARALRARGQHVSVDSRAGRHRSTRDLDDVLLVLRGLDTVEPRPGCLNIEWVISHPDLVTPAELAGFDLAYAASLSWPEQVRAAHGVHVRPLLQATDPALFSPDRAEFDTGPDVVFVGNSRGIFRSSLRLALEAGADVEVHGAGWSQFLPDGVVESPLVDNTELGALYASAGVVLNDHWDDMREYGFISNRLMDAAASGARVASDRIPGVDLTAVFGGLVRTYEDTADMERLLAGAHDLFPRGEDRRAAAARVAAEHSFDARAAVLLDDAVAALRDRRA